MACPQEEDRVVLWTEDDVILGWAIARWYPKEKWAWRRRYGKRTWTRISHEPQWVIGWFVDPEHRGRGIMSKLGAILSKDLERIMVQPQDPAVTRVCLNAGWVCEREGTIEPWQFGLWNMPEIPKT